MTMYMFGTRERLQYQRNLNRVGLSWDPIYFRVYLLSEFKHTVTRYRSQCLVGFLDCLLSWVSVCGRIYKIMKAREIQGMLTPEQKQAAFVLRNADLPNDQVFEKLKILDPDIREPGNVRLIGVDSEEFSHVFAKALVDEKAREILVPLLEASGMTFTKREKVLLKYAVGEDPDNTDLKALVDEYRSTDVTDLDSEIFFKQLEIIKAVFGTNEPK
jgi:hypothetical protein